MCPLTRWYMSRRLVRWAALRVWFSTVSEFVSLWMTLFCTNLTTASCRASTTVFTKHSSSSHLSLSFASYEEVRARLLVLSSRNGGELVFSLCYTINFNFEVSVVKVIFIVSVLLTYFLEFFLTCFVGNISFCITNSLIEIPRKEVNFYQY